MRWDGMPEFQEVSENMLFCATKVRHLGTAGRPTEHRDEAYDQQFNTIYTFLTTEQYTLTTRFFETLASRVVQVFEILNKDVENWLKAVMSPMEGQVREHQMQLRRRLESVKRIHKAADTLDDRIGELDQMLIEVTRQHAELNNLSEGIRGALILSVLQPERLAA